MTRAYLIVPRVGPKVPSFVAVMPVLRAKGMPEDELPQVLLSTSTVASQLDDDGGTCVSRASSLVGFTSTKGGLKRGQEQRSKDRRRG